MQLRYLQAPAQGLSWFEPRAAHFSSQLLTLSLPVLLRRQLGCNHP